MFTRQTLRQLSSDKVFGRGQDLYAAGAVKKLQRPAPTRFLARVKGTYSYNTMAWLASGEVEFSCDCPYELEGICKHCVALGLAILDTYGPTLADSPVAEASALPAALARAWATRPAADKLHFLEQALGKNEDLARQFLAFEHAPASLSTALAAAVPDPLEDLAERLTDTLSGLCFDEEFWERNHGYDDYEGEGLYAAALEEVSAELQPFVAELLRLARAGQLTLALRYWATASLAIYQVEEPAIDEFGLFGDYGTDVQGQWETDLQAANWPQALLTAVLPAAELQAALAWAGQYLADPPGQWANFEESWGPVLLAFAADASAAALLPAALAAARLSPGTQARLRLQTARTQADDRSWVENAEALLPTDAYVAEQLLQFYRNQGDGAALLRTAETAFAIWPNRFAGFVLDALAPAQPLYRAALRYRTLANHSLPDFERLRPLLSPAELAGLVQAATSQARATHDGVAFAAELLARQADADGLRQLVLGLEWTSITRPDDVDLALARLAELNPLPLMLELETRLPAYLAGRAGAKRGAVLYQRLARWLATVRRAAPRLTEPVLRLAQSLREEFRTLHGLRDALQAQGLLPATETIAAAKPKGRGR